MSPRLLFVHNRRRTFVEIDLALLRENYSVTEWHGGVLNVRSLVRAVAASDLVFGWFASRHTFFPVLLAKWMQRPTVLVVGGYDTANLPRIGYGNERGGLRRWVTRWVMQHADRLVTNSSFTRDEAIRNAGVNAERVTVVYHGLRVPPRREREKEKSRHHRWRCDAGHVVPERANSICARGRPSPRRAFHLDWRMARPLDL